MPRIPELLLHHISDPCMSFAYLRMEGIQGNGSTPFGL
jgi:hypothetical protein